MIVHNCGKVPSCLIPIPLTANANVSQVPYNMLNLKYYMNNENRKHLRILLYHTKKLKLNLLTRMMSFSASEKKNRYTSKIEVIIIIFSIVCTKLRKLPTKRTLMFPLWSRKKIWQYELLSFAYYNKVLVLWWRIHMRRLWQTVTTLHNGPASCLMPERV